MAISGAVRARLFGQPGAVDRVTYTTPWGPKVSIHPQILAPFKAACEEAHRVSDWVPLRIDSFNPRPIRGEDGDDPDEWSLHAFALAFDFFATPPGVPPPGGVWTPDDEMPADFAGCFVKRGFRWGATFKRRDTPHIEWPSGLPAITDAPPAAPQEDDMVRIVTFKGPAPFGPDNQWVVDYGAKTRWRVPDPGMRKILKAAGMVELTEAQDGGGHFREIT